MIRSLLFPLCAAVVAAGAAVACSSSGGDAQGATCNVAIDRFKELMVVEESVVTNARARNDLNGPWSFRHAIEGIMPPGADKSKFILSWLDNWVTTTEVNGFKTDLESRVEGMNVHLVCPWLRETPANACNETCTTCAGRELDLAKAPFRLRAIVNRTDLRLRPDSASPAGESRLVFGMTLGPADDPSSKYAALSMIFEYGLPESHTPLEWVEAWHALGAHPAFDEAYMTDLEKLTESFVARGASPSLKNGSALAQVRTNESAFNWIWQLRQFRLDSLGDLRLTALNNTPGQALNGSTALQSYILDNADKIMADQHILPESMLAGSADQLQYRWTFPQIPEPLRLAFARSTCNGCHTGENPIVDTAFHVSPYRDGVAKLSQYLNNPADPEHDELGARTRVMSNLLCESKN
jgi:hypothetical protein